MFKENNERENNPDLLKYVKKIPRYSSETANGVEKWGTADNNIEELNDADIAEIVLSGTTDDMEKGLKNNQKCHLMRHFMYWKNLKSLSNNKRVFQHEN